MYYELCKCKCKCKLVFTSDEDKNKKIFLLEIQKKRGEQFARLNRYLFQTGIRFLV